MLASVLGFVFLLLLANAVAAERGVGVNIGSIDVAQELSPGGGYVLPAIGVINAGDQPDEYELAVKHVEGRSELQPDPGWFSFQPARFSLEPGESRTVSIDLDLPAGADPGDYFAYIEAHPMALDAGGAAIGVAAATRLSFTVEPSSWLEGQRVRIERWIEDHQPWTFIVPAAALLIFLATWLQRRYRLGIQIQRK